MIAFAQTVIGRMAILVMAFVLLVWHDSAPRAGLYLQDTYYLMIVAVALVFLFPSRTRLMLSLCSFAMIVSFVGRNLYRDFGLTGILAGTDASAELLRGCAFIMGVMAILSFTFVVTKRLEELPVPIRTHPVMSLHIVMLTGLVLIGTVPALYMFVDQTWLIPFLIWRLGYMILYASQGKMKDGRFRDHLFYLLPIFGGQDLTIGKGLGYLERKEAPAGEPLARSQLAGLRLLLIGAVWSGCYELMNAAVYGDESSLFAPILSGWTLDMPLLIEDMSAATASAGLAWISIYLELFRVVLSWALWGATIVGCLRLLGFNVFRNTYKPLLAESVVDYWNRFSYYFKEICVDFFFYPAFIRSRWAGPRLRLFIAVFAAAFLGNLYYHLLLYPQWFLTGEWTQIWEYWSPRIVYCLLLTIGIWLSMLRQQAIRRGGVGLGDSRLSRARRLLGVWTFYALIRIWSIPNSGIDFTDRMRFCGALLGI